jgi:hypothetical protein
MLPHLTVTCISKTTRFRTYVFCTDIFDLSFNGESHLRELVREFRVTLYTDYNCDTMVISLSHSKLCNLHSCNCGIKEKQRIDLQIIKLHGAWSPNLVRLGNTPVTKF